MKVQSINQLVGVLVEDSDGRRIGRVVSAHMGAELFTVDWLVVKAPWRRLRAVPADDATATLTGLQVSLTKDYVLASPRLPGCWPAGTAAPAAIESHYADTSSATTRQVPL